MALIICPSCGKSISDKAASCPHCGYSVTNESSPKEKSPKAVRVKIPVEKAKSTTSNEPIIDEQIITDRPHTDESSAIVDAPSSPSNKNGRIIIIILSLVIIGLIVALIMSHTSKSDNSNRWQSTQQTSSSNEEANISGSFSVDKVVHDDEYLTLTCKSIDSEGILFEVKSKLNNRDISFDIDCVSLDGVTTLGSYGNFVDLSPGETQTIRFNSPLDAVEHSQMSLTAIAFNDQGTGFDEIDICDFDLGGNKHTSFDPNTAPSQYKTSGVNISFVDVTEEGIVFAVTNYDSKSINITGGITNVNGTAFDEYQDARTVPANSTLLFARKVFDTNPDLTPNAIKSFIYEGYTFQNGSKVDEFNISVNR